MLHRDRAHRAVPGRVSLPGRFASAVVASLACVIVALSVTAARGAAQPKSVLILTSESLEMPGLATVIRGVSDGVRGTSSRPINVDTESLDRSRFPGDDGRLVALLTQRYTRNRPDLLITLAAPAAEFALRYRAELFGDTPLLYGFLDEKMAEALKAPKASSGVTLRSDFRGFTDLALKLHPNVRRIAVVGGASEFDRGWQTSFKAIAGELQGRVAIRYLTEVTLQELLGEVATLPEDSLVLYLSMTRDREGALYVPRDVLDMIRRVSTVPVYAPSTTYVGRGAVGGPVLDLEAHGKTIGRLAARALSGEAIDSIKPEVTPPRLVFDWRELNRFGVRESSLPDGAQVIFRQSAWPIHQGWIVAVLSLFAAQTALVVALVAQRRKRVALQHSLDGRLGFGTLLSDVSTALNAVPLRSLDGTIRSVLERIRQYFDVEHVAILDCSVNPTACRSHADTAPGDRQLAIAGALAAAPFGSLKLASFQPLIIGSPDDLPGDSAAEREALRAVGVQSLAMVAMEVGGQVLGVLCCLSATRRRPWPAEPQQQLRTLAEVLANALERQQTAASVAESDRLKGAILSSMSAHITVLDRHGVIIAVNDAWTAFGRANGVRNEAAISPGVDYLEVCRRAVADGAGGAREALEGIQAVCDGRRAVFEWEYQCDAPQLDRWFQMKVLPLRRPEGGVVVTHRETTVERRHEIALRESERRFRLLADALPVGVWVTGGDGACTYVNRTWTEWTGRPPERELGDGWLDRVHPDDLSRALRTLRDAVATKRAFATEFRLRRHDGRFRWLLNHGRPRYDDSGQVVGFVGGSIDMTERLEAQSQLRELSGRLIRAQEEERRRVARELHDDLQQRLALLAIELEGMALGRPLGGRADWAAQARRLWTCTNEISSEVHRISHRLLPLKLETLGLLRTVESYCRELAPQGMRVVFVHDNVPATVPDEVALCVFRVVQESLRNVAKHSGSAEAHVSLSGSEGGLTLVITDAGCGFDLDAAGASGGLGLLSMRERLYLVGGDIDVQSSSGGGTRIAIRVPMEALTESHDGRPAPTVAEAS
jgi:PAS domain S-box-containing protein